MSRSNSPDLEDLRVLLDDPRGPFFERDLRQMRWQLTRQECSRASIVARAKLATGLEHLARWLRAKPSSATVRLS